MADNQEPQMKTCAYCGETKPVEDFQRRTGRRSGKHGRRGPCRACRIERKTKLVPADAATALPPADEPPIPSAAPAATAKKKRRKSRRKKRKPAVPDATEAPVLESPLAAPAPPAGKPWVPPPLPELPPLPEGPDASVLRVNRQGTVGMRGKTDKGRRWYQETDLETAVTLVKERAAIVVNRHTIRRIYSNKAFRRYILTRDKFTCYFCGEYGDTIDHLLPRAKGGHTTPVNCVAACHLCNQSKADQDLQAFIDRGPPVHPPSPSPNQ